MNINKLIDFISGKQVWLTPEEKVLQHLAQELIDVYGYSKSDIKTRPQFFIPTSPSSSSKYPVDVAVFEQELKMVCECKKPNVKTGRKQLEIYLRNCEAKFGVWTNGEERLILEKIENFRGIDFKEINNIPPPGIWDVEKHPRYDDLKPRTNLKNPFYQIKKHLQKTIIGSTSEPDIARNFLKIVFCKIFDERYKPGAGNNFVAFYTEKENLTRLLELWQKVKRKSDDIFVKSEEIDFDPKSIIFVVQRLQYISLMDQEQTQ